MNEKIQSIVGITFPIVVFIVFLTLKLSKVIAWSWWWVTSPLWIPAGLALILIIIAMIAIVLEVRRDNRNYRKVLRRR